MESIRIQEHSGASPRTQPATHCQLCSRTTTGGKPYCARHVERMPYVLELLQRIPAPHRGASRSAGRRHGAA